MACWAVQLTIGITVRNPLTVVFFVLFLMLGERKNLRTKGFAKTVGIGISLLASAILTFVSYKDAISSFENAIFRLLVIVILVAGFFFAGLLIFGVASKEGNDKSWKITSMKSSVMMKLSGNHFKAVLIVMGVCILFWLPYYLYEFPGIMTADSIVQYYEIIGIEPVSNHHPILHTLIIALFYKIGMAMSANPLVGVALYTFFQMMFLSFCCGELVWHIEKRGLKLAALAFFALVPFNAVFAVTVWKDIYHAAFTMLLICSLSDIIKKDAEAGARDYVKLVILMLLFALFRSNAWYALLVWTPFAICFFRKRIAHITVSLAIVIALVIIIKGPVMSSFGVGQPDLVESLSVPAQQIARILADDIPISDQEKELIEAVIDTTYIHELYVPDYADNIKELIRAGHPEVIEDNKGRYLGLWAGLVIHHPIEAVKAWYDLVGGYFYPDVRYEVGNIDGVISNVCGLYWNPLIGGKFVKVKEILIKLGSFVPLYGLLWSIGSYTWLLIIAFIGALKNKTEYITKLLLIMTVGTLLIAAPVVDFRYGYSVVMTMPLWIECLLGRKDQSKREKMA